MKENIFKRLKPDYLLVVLIWIVIFWKNLFSQMVFVDFTPDTYFSIPKMLFLSGYTSSFSLLDLLRFVFYYLWLLPILFQLSIIITMFVSYFYIKKMFKNKGLLFSLLFSLIFFFNPFVYSRIMIGQIGVVLAYLCMPIFIYYVFEFFDSGFEKKSLMKLILAFSLTSLFSIHFFIINFAIFLIASFWFFYKSHLSFKKYFIGLMFLIVITVLLNAFWLQGFFSGSILSKISSSDQDFFSPKLSDGIPALVKILGMSGFWRDNSYVSTYEIIPKTMWYICLGIIVLIFLLGFFVSDDRKSKFFYTLFWIKLILGTGISHPYTKPFFDVLFKYLPFFNGFRDSHKLVSLIAVSYAYFLPLCILSFIKKLNKKIRFVPVLFLIGLIIFFSFPLINLHDQIKSVNYPLDYYELNHYFNNQKISGKIIYLPWQTYLTYKWTYGSSSDGRIAVPINQIINYPVLVGPDRWGSETGLTAGISPCIEEQNIKCLEENSVEYVIKDRCTLYFDDYEWLDKQVNRSFENNCLDVYKLNNKSYGQENMPLRFIFGSLISIITLLSLLFLLSKWNKVIEVF